MRAPAAEGVRVEYDVLPAHIREWVDEALGERVVDAVTQRGGFSPGVAARLRGDHAARAFVKAVSAEANPESPDLHRREAAVLSMLPADLPVPRLRASYDDGTWVVLLIDDVDGRQPRLPWHDDELDRMVRLTREVSAVRGLPLRAASDDLTRWSGWREFAANGEAPASEWARTHLGALAELEAMAADSVPGDHLVHLDTRADNVLLADDGAWLVDWPWAVTGPAWLDAVVSAPAVAMQGGPQPEDYLQCTGLARDADPEAVTAVVAAFAGMLSWLASRPPPPGLPTVRAFQAAQAEVAERWLAARTGW